MKIKKGKYKTIEGVTAKVVDVRNGQAIGWVVHDRCSFATAWNARSGVCFDSEDRDIDLSSTSDSLKLHVAQIIEQNKNKPGFKGDWLSSAALNEVIGGDPQWLKAGPARRGGIFKSFGYIKHPAFYNGRSPVIINGERPTIYVKAGSVLAALSTSRDAIQQYLYDQGVTA